MDPEQASDGAGLEQIEVPIHGVLVAEGVETGDRRKFTQGALTWRDLPIPLAWQKTSMGGHDGSTVTGRIDTIERAEDGTLPFTGVTTVSAESDEMVGLIAEMGRYGVSVDVDSVSVELQNRDGSTFDFESGAPEDDVLEVITSGRISGATACAIPAFSEAYVSLGHPEPKREAVVASGDAVAAQSVKSILEGLPVDPEVLDQLSQASEEDLPSALEGIAESEPDGEKAGALRDAAEKIRGLLNPGDSEEPEEEMASAPAEGEVPPVEGGIPGLPELSEEEAARISEAAPEEVPDVLDQIASEAGEGEKADQLRKAAEAMREAIAGGQEPPEKEGSVTASAEFVDAAPGLTEDGPGWLTHPEETDTLRDYWVRGAGAAQIGWGLPGDFNRCRALTVQYVGPKHISGYCANRHKDALGIWPGQHGARTITASAGEPVAPVYRLVASSAPIVPPIEWFANPGLQGPTGLTVTKDGQVFGHVATWGTCHVGFSGSCVTPPTSDTEYAYFLTGLLETTGGDIRVGQITFDTGHAEMQDSARRAMAHYDNTGSVAADVMCGEDEIGIWVAGALRPGVSDEQIRTLRGSKMSGDWREVGGNLEMVAALCVNSGGFPIPRPALAASAGHQTAMVAAGMVRTPEKSENFTVEEVVAATVARIEANRRAQEDIAEVSAAFAAEDIERTLAGVQGMEVDA